jgi:hypothetical protein
MQAEPFAALVAQTNESFLVNQGTGGSLGDSGAPMFEEILVNGVYNYAIAGIASSAYLASSSSQRAERCKAIKSTEVSRERVQILILGFAISADRCYFTYRSADILFLKSANQLVFP